MTAAPGGETLRGIGVSRGIAIGEALVVEGPDIQVARIDLGPDLAPREVRRLKRALKEGARELRHLRDRVREQAGETYARMFQAQILILKDPALLAQTVGLIRREGVNAEWALSSVLGRYRRIFAEIAGADLVERGTDIEDVEIRLLALLTGSRRRRDLAALTHSVIVVSPSLASSDAAGLDRARVLGLAIDGGGPTSHTAIIASALGIPAVVGLRAASASVRTGDLLVLDGAAGTLVRNPPDVELEAWRRRRARQAGLVDEHADLRDRPAESLDGVRVRLLANLELPEQVDAARRCGAEGIGLYRSEFLYLRGDKKLPDEEEQYRVYRDLAERTAPHGVVIRTLDMGGEESSARLLERREANPVLGLRGIRLSLRREALFMIQARAILRAAAHGRVRMMFPMVTAPEELRQARRVIDAARAGLEAEGVPCGRDVPIGVMIEVPAAALIADRLAGEADFFSIGTNDLIQYTLAIDRGNPSVAYLYQPLHPAVLLLVRKVVEAAAPRQLPVSVCGEMAADPVAALVLVGLGVRELSMSPVAIPGIKQVIRGVPIGAIREVVEEALRLDTISGIDERVRGRILSLLPADYACPIREGPS